MKLLATLALLVWCSMVQGLPVRLLSDDAVWMIVVNTPDAIDLEARGGCPTVEVTHLGTTLADAQLRNSCPKSGSGLINNYTIDRRSGIIWTGIDVRKFIDSERLRRLRALLTTGA